MLNKIILTLNSINNAVPFQSNSTSQWAGRGLGNWFQARKASPLIWLWEGYDSRWERRVYSYRHWRTNNIYYYYFVFQNYSAYLSRFKVIETSDFFFYFNIFFISCN